MTRYKIIKIEHSGRRGIRGEPVTDEKYDGLVNSIFYLKGIDVLEQCEQFSMLHMIFIETSSYYNDWRTSEVLQIIRHFDDLYEVETVNTIYYLMRMPNN